MDYPKPLQVLIDSFTKMPGIGRKSAERIAFYLMSGPIDSEAFAAAIIDVKSKIVRCPVCFSAVLEEENCKLCFDSTRDSSVVMVLETLKDMYIMEKMGIYYGLFHVLDGAINFSKGIGIDDINIAPLLKRIEKGTIKEVILATNATVEGETTARYIKEVLTEFDVNVTRIAYGLPVGGDIGYADEVTLLKAIEGRRKY